MASFFAIGAACRRHTAVAIWTVLLTLVAQTVLTSGAAAQQTSENPPRVPDAFKLNLLIRTTLIALNHANQTGNYTVFRDIAAPSFARTNNAARLAEIFAKLRKRDLDLAPILFFQPKLRRPAAINDRGLLRMTGFFETKPEQVSFDLLFQRVAEDWRLYGIAVDVAPPAGDAQRQSQAASPQPAAQQADSQPGTTRDSASADIAREQPKPQPPSEPEFVAHAVNIPTPVRRPDELPTPVASTPSEPRAAQERTPVESDDSGFWPF